MSNFNLNNSASQYTSLIPPIATWNFNFNLQLQSANSNFNFKPQLQITTSSPSSGWAWPSSAPACLAIDLNTSLLCRYVLVLSFDKPFKYTFFKWLINNELSIKRMIKVTSQVEKKFPYRIIFSELVLYSNLNGTFSWSVIEFST